MPHDLRFYKLSSSYVKLYLTSIFGLTVPTTHMPSNSVSWSSVTGSFYMPLDRHISAVVRWMLLLVTASLAALLT